MRLVLLFLLIVLAAVPASAQEDSSLTREFSNLNAKERARLAKTEQEGAAKDAGFQTTMAQAEEFFRKQQYDEALERYQEARRLRPLNVYPKVKIQDLQALIAKRDALQTEKQAVQATPPPVPEPATPVVEQRAVVEPAIAKPIPVEPVVVKPVPVVVRPDSVPAPVKPRPVERKGVPPPVQKKPPGTTTPVVKPTVLDTTAPPPDGLNERTYMEGRAVVLERKMVQDGKLEVYRKVTHPWGQVVYFKDGLTISDRMWKEAFPDR